MYVLRRTSVHGLVMAAFLVDMWCAGLKDARGRLSATMDAFQEWVPNPRGGIRQGFKQVDPAAVRRLVAGGIRFAEQNGFRLPSRDQRWTAMLGDLRVHGELYDPRP